MKYLIEDVKVGVSKGGIACGPVGGSVIAELRLMNSEDNSIVFYGITEVEGIPCFLKSDESIFEFQLKDDPDDEAGWAKVRDAEVDAYSDYSEIYSDLDDPDVEDVEEILIWKLLAYFVRAEWDDVEAMKKKCIGRYLEDIEIPVCDAEQDYLDENEEDVSDIDPAYEQRLLEDICAEYIGRQLDMDLLKDELGLEDGETPEGDYSIDDTFQDGDYNEYNYSCSYSLNENGVITDIGEASCEMLLGEDAASCTYIQVSADMAYDRLRDFLDGLMA